MQLTKCCPCPTSSTCTQDLAPVDRFSISYDSYIPPLFSKIDPSFAMSHPSTIFFLGVKRTHPFTPIWHPFSKNNGNKAGPKNAIHQRSTDPPPQEGSPTLQQPSNRGYFPSFGLLGSTKTDGWDGWLSGPGNFGWLKIFSETHVNKQHSNQIVEDLSFGKLIFLEVDIWKHC